MEKSKFKVGDKVHYKGQTSNKIYTIGGVKYDISVKRNIYTLKELPTYFYYSYQLEKVDPKSNIANFNSTVTLEFDKTTLNTIDSTNKFKNCANKITVDGVVIKNRYGDIDENTRAFKLTLEEAQEMYNAGGKSREFALKVFTEDELKPKPKYPKTWDEYCDNFYRYEKRTHYIPKFAHGFDGDDADALIAYGKLIRLRRAWIDDWKPDWNNQEISKWCIGYWKNEIDVFDYGLTMRSLSFPTKEMAENFMNYFKDLLEKAKTLI